MSEMKREIENGSTVIYDGDDRYAIRNEFGSPDVTLNNNRVPSGRFWTMVVDEKTARGVDYQLPEKQIVMELKRASIFRMERGLMLVVTANPKRVNLGVTTLEDNVIYQGGSPIQTSFGAVVCARSLDLRIRPFIDEWDIVIGLVDLPGMEKKEQIEGLQVLFQAAETLGLFPVYAADRKYYFTNAANRTELRKRFGDNWHNAYIRRPGSYRLPVDGSELPTFSEEANDGTVAIDPNVRGMHQGTFISDDHLLLTKGMWRGQLTDPYTRRVELPEMVKEMKMQAAEADGSKRSGYFYKLSSSGRERCTWSYQATLFSLKDPAAFIARDNGRIASLSVKELYGSRADRLMRAGVPLSLIWERDDPWLMLRKFEIYGVRATAIGTDLVSPGTFKLLPKSASALEKRLKKAWGDEVELEVGQQFYIHRDPALPNGSSMYLARYGGTVRWVCSDDQVTQYGVCISPKDPGWSTAGGDFDGDSASVLVPMMDFDSVDDVAPMESYRVEGAKYHSSDTAGQMLEDAESTVKDMLGPTILSAMRLAERGLLTDDLKTVASSVAQTSVDAKKHAVDEAKAKAGQATLFDQVLTGSDQGMNEYFTTLMNELQRNAKTNEERVKAWKELVRWALMKNRTRSPIEKAMVHRILLLDRLFRDSQFLRSQIRAELPENMRKIARERCTKEMYRAVQPLCTEHQTLVDEFREYHEQVQHGLDYGDDSFSEDGAVNVLMDRFRALKQKFIFFGATGGLDAQVAIIGYGPARSAVAACRPSTFEGLGSEYEQIKVNLIGLDWKPGTYHRSELKPIPNSKRDLELFCRNHETVEVELLEQPSLPGGRRRRSTRVQITRVTVHQGENEE